jgi:hypothetical protein
MPTPGSVQAAAILLYVGGGLTVLSTLLGFASGTLGGVLRSAVYLLFGVLYIALARAVQRRRRWARRLVLVLCGFGVALAGFHLFDSGIYSAVAALAWPMVYAILLTTETARSWFHRPNPEPVS